MRVLIVEDSENDAKLIALALRKGGLPVEYVRVEDASSMRAALEKGRWDLVLSDWSLPSFSALGALDVLKGMGVDIPFIILSGTIGEDTAVHAMRAGAHDFLVKDQLARLGPAIERELRASKGRAEHRRGEEAVRTRDAVQRAIVEDSGSASLAGRLRRTFVLIGAMVGVAFFGMALSYAVSLGWLVPEIDESLRTKEAVAELNAAVLDEETGLRGYLLTRDVDFLEPYHRGELAFARANEELEALVAPVHAFAVELERTRAAGERWREKWAKPVAEAPVDGFAPSAQEGKALFDAFRVEEAALASAIAHRITELSRREQRAVGLRATFMLAILGSLFVLALRQHRVLRDAIVAPVAALLRDICRVRDGELITNVHQSGPSELRQLGAGLDEMVRALAVARGVAESRDEIVREHSNRLRQILDASREFSESLNLAYVVRSVQTSTMAVGGYDEVIVWLMDDEQRRLRDASAAESAVTPAESADTGIAERAAKSGRIMFEGSNGRARFGPAGVGPLRAIAIPLIVGARVVGALEVRHADAQVANGEAVEILELLAAHAATAIESARLHQISEDRSQTDPLTRLHNRRRLEEDLDAECKRCVRYGRPLAFVMLDVDHFKNFNDAHGHPQADVALQQVAEIIEGAVRTTDSAYRYGGEEFCVLLRETDAENAMHFAERLRQRIELRFANSTTPGITASFGVAEFSADTRTPRTLVEAADAAMYESKHAGRNRVSLSAPPPTNTRASASSGTMVVAPQIPPADSGTLSVVLEEDVARGD